MTTDTSQDLRAEVRKERREFARSRLGRMARLMWEAVTDYLKARREGMSREDGVRGIEAVLRDVWPLRPTRVKPCDFCGDTGYRETACNYAMRCGRYRCSTSGQEWEHAYVVPCDCALGDKFRAKAHVSGEDQLASVGRTRKKPSNNWRTIGS